MLSHESTDLFNGFSCFWEVGSEGVPDVGHVGVHTNCDVNAGRTGVLNGLCRVVEKNFCVANVEEERIFRSSLKGLQYLYAHQGTWVWCMKSLPPHLKINPYDMRGWYESP